MLKPEEYAEIVKAVNDKEQLTHEQAVALVRTIQQMDLQLLIGQNALQLATENMSVMIPAVAQKTMERCGRTDKKIKRRIAEMAAEAVGSFEESLQSYLAGALLEAARLLEINIEDLLGVEEEELDESLTEEVAE
jgi:hypothetical protein